MWRYLHLVHMVARSITVFIGQVQKWMQFKYYHIFVYCIVMYHETVKNIVL